MADERGTKVPMGDGINIGSESDSVHNRPTASAMQQPAQQQHEFTLRKLFGGAMECLLPAAYVDVSDLRQVPDHQEAFVSRSDGVSVVIEVLSFETDIDTPCSPPLAPVLPSGDGDGSVAGIGGESARHFFDDLAEANGATSSTCDFCADVTHSVMPKLSKFSKAALAGRQIVTKFRGDGSPEAVRVYLVNVRLPDVDTDLLLTVNVPYPDEASAAASPSTADAFIFASDNSTTTPKHPNNAGVDMAAGGSQHSDATDCVAGTPDCHRREEELSSRPEGEGDGDLGSDAAGVAAMRMLVESFNILDWSLFG